MKHILKTYQKRLTNLTARNRSLLLLRLPKQQFIDAHDLDFLLNKPSFNIIEQLIEGNHSVPVCELLDPRNERSNEKSKQLTQISRTEKLIIEERGAEDLYVGYPIVKGKFSDGTVVRCPLLFFPVSLATKTVQKKNVWCLEQRDSGVIFNRSFLLAYAHFNNIKLPDEWLDVTFDDFPKNTLGFRTALYEMLKNSPVEINFNQTIFQNQLIDYKDVKKDELTQGERNGELKLYPQAVLGIFPQAGSYVAADYETLLQNPAELPNDFTDFFFSEHAESNQLIREEALLLPLAVDASQERTIAEAKRGKSMVVQGPPGTGKSQLIANLIADFTARGKRVLVVCQKRAALDTVFERLEPVGLADFVALIHDFKNDRKILFSKISKQIESIDIYKKNAVSLNSVLLDREFSAACREIDRTVRELDELKAVLFDEQIAGKSIKEMYLSTALFKSTPSIIDFSNLYHFFRLNETDEFLRKINQFEQYQKFLQEDSVAYRFWKQRTETTNWSSSQLATLTHSINSIRKAFETFQGQLNRYFPMPLSLLKLPENFESNLQMASSEMTDDATFTYFKKFHEDTAWKAKLLDEVTLKNSISVLNSITDFNPESAFFGNPLSADYLKMLQDGLPSTTSYLDKLRWLYFGKYKAMWKRFSQEFKIVFTSENVRQFIKEISENQQFFSIKTQLDAYGVSLPTNTIEAAQKLEKILISKRIFEETRATFEASNLIKIDESEKFQETCDSLLEVIAESKRVFASGKGKLSEEQLVMLEQHEDTQSLIAYLNKTFDYLIENDQLLNSFTDVERQLLTKVLHNFDISQERNLAETIRYNLTQHWIAHIEAQHPVLRSVDTLKISQLEQDLQGSMLKKQELCKTIVLARLRENTYKNLQKNRLGNTVTYRELGHQVTKKRQLWSIRKLVENFFDELLTLIPCWLASPETVSAVFPIRKDTFDLIIFDEASQCYIEHGLPAALRGKQVIIAGDKQQLQPADLYQIRFEEEREETELLLEIDSLLEVASQYLPQTSLRGHYRSKSLDLISFSNQYFYENKLILLPDYEEINDSTPNIHYANVSGVWDNNCNLIEAQKVVNIVQAFDQKRSVGVVTFNYKQAELIDNLLNEEARPRTNIRVKNIENIQGDEFDVVIFSIGYAPNKEGNLRMNFGSLNQQGGENRLNVAITRAKSEIYVVSSIMPNQLSVANSLHSGPKLLQRYLQYALDVSQGNPPKQLRPPVVFKPEKTLKNFLVNEHNNPEYDLLDTLPFADLVVYKSGKYHDLLLTDDELYYDSPSSKDTHGYLPLLLKEKGWRFQRKWSRTVR